jgi:DNA ligase-1
LLTGLCT